MKTFLTILIFFLIVTSVSADMSVKLDRMYCVASGDYVQLPVRIENSYPSYTLGGFDLNIEFDQRLIYSGVQQGVLLTTCGWEYFSFSTPTSNTIRIVAIADLNNGTIHPSCYADSSGILALIDFQIDPNIEYGDEFIPVWWSWADCGDNTLSSLTGDALYISDSVYYFDGVTEFNLTQDNSFPTPAGAPNECISGTLPTPLRTVDFYSGGFDISPTGFQIQCPSDIVTPAEDNLCGAYIDFTIPLNSECPGVSSVSNPPSGSFFPIGTTIVTTRATDYLGHIDYCSFSITVEDTNLPQITDIPNDTVLYSTPGKWWAQLDYSITASDSCSDVTISSTHPSGTYFPIGINNVICIATDSFGNADTAQFTVTVLDTEAPVIQCPDTIFAMTALGECGTNVEFEIAYSDNSNMVTLSTSIESGSYFQKGITEVQAIAVDQSGNSDSCSFVIIVEDLESPQIQCISTINVPNQIDQCGAVVSYDLTVTDNCGEVQVDYSIPSSEYFPVGSTVVYVTATDESQNVDSCQFTVIVQDIQYPGIALLGDITQETDLNQCGAVVDYYYYISENCGGYTLTTTGDPGSFYEVGSTLVVATIIDRAGNSATDSMNIFIEDNQPPIIENIDDITVLSDSGYYGSFVSYAPMISDNCQLDSFSISPESGSYFDVGTHEVSVSATDIYGNSDSTAFVVNVVLKDFDNDSIADFEDNCITRYNPEQEDSNNDGIGDACCCVGIRGNVDSDQSELIDISDLVMMVTFVFDRDENLILSCPAEADIDADGLIDISDLVMMVSYMFEPTAPPPLPCY